MAALIEAFLAFIVDAVIGSVPQRQPWRALVMVIYALILAGGVVGFAWVISTAFR